MSVPREPSVTAKAANRIDLDAIVTSVHDAIATRVFPAEAAETGFDQVLRRCVGTNIGSLVDIATGRKTVEDTEFAPILTFAGLTAELGIPFSSLERAYWVGLEQFWQQWLALAFLASDSGDRSMNGVFGNPTHAVFAYFTQAVDLIGDQYKTVTDQLASTGEDRRRALVEEILDGGKLEYGQFLDDELGYRLRACHVALLLESGDRHEVVRVVATLRQQTGAWGSLMVQRGASSWAVWLGYARRQDTKALTRIKQAVSLLGMPMAMGGPSNGIDGLRRSHEEATRAAALRTTLAYPGDCLWYRDVRLEALLLEDKRAAHRFIAEELGELAEDTERADRIRETLLMSLSAGSQAKAAAELGVHENTVRMRLRGATELLGEALTERRTELLVALRLRRALGGPERTGDSSMEAAG
ncbi:DNA-binding transcriptional regulator, PucR family [Amycolatopsis xylanica]|uniref:DNA-binding transcriptional regulator, PucR family n=1 Tax=Amycolatopsis xylanica TaxID=589385 RepID=A0A1H3PA00_9PSEU|nr:helix-turn-helix domain-containing protein [Amycolatopsis xylanica]SDY97911.1 DNA-binding transcriptional regulator, PucR family [Amycolatopsis xylanica]